MRKLFISVLLSLSVVAFSQVITGEELHLKVKSAQEDCEGAHESIVLRTNEELAKSLWGKTVRLNEAMVVKFFNHTAGEQVSGGVDVLLTRNKAWSYAYDQKTVSDLLTANGVRVTQSYNKQWINAKQDILLAETEKNGQKIILKLYCPHEKLLQLLRIGKTQSIEFLISGYFGNTTSADNIYGVLTKVNAEKPYIKCSNGHEYDKATGYKFCPECGEPLK
jgi:Zn finger protein HypA/HybF involved in hydrogenase expression